MEPLRMKQRVVRRHSKVRRPSSDGRAFAIALVVMLIIAGIITDLMLK